LPGGSAPIRLKQLQNVCRPLVRASDTGAVSSASRSQKIDDGRVFGSYISSRCATPACRSADPARAWALVAAVSTLTIGTLGASSRGLTAAASPS